MFTPLCNFELCKTMNHKSEVIDPYQILIHVQEYF